MHWEYILKGIRWYLKMLYNCIVSHRIKLYPVFVIQYGNNLNNSTKMFPTFDTQCFALFCNRKSLNPCLGKGLRRKTRETGNGQINNGQ